MAARMDGGDQVTRKRRHFPWTLYLTLASVAILAILALTRAPRAEPGRPIPMPDDFAEYLMQEPVVPVVTEPEYDPQE
jgi:hypothetical protein